MTTNRYVLLRHGESEANVERIIVSLLGRGKSAYGLTARGREQVADGIRRAREARLLTRVDRIVASPFLRTSESADIAASALGASVEIDDRLTERGFGELEGTSDAGYAQVWARDRQDPSHADCGVESVTAVFLRASGLIGDLETAGSDRTILLCTHGDVASILTCGFLREDLSRHRDVGGIGLGEVRPLRRK